jgi:protoporphyrinogen oxidase
LSRPKTAVIIGAGPAGLTAAYELLTRTDIRPIVIEMSDHIGGISRTVNYKGNRIDIGGHRFFSKSDRVMNWWFQHLPMQPPASAVHISYQGKSRDVAAAGSAASGPDDRVMLVRERKSRIFFLRRFFDYPIALTPDTIKKLGLIRTAGIGLSYMRRVLFPLKEQKNLEQFFINRFGEKLYHFFQIVHRKGVGRALHGNRCGMGRATYQRAFDMEDGQALREQQISARSGGRFPESDGNIADRTVPVPEIRARPNVGGSRR